METYSVYFFGILLLQGAFGNPLIFDVIGNIVSDAAKEISDATSRISRNFPSNQHNHDILSVSDLFGNVARGTVDFASDFGQAAVRTAGKAIHIKADVIKSGVDIITNVGKSIENSVRESIKAFNNVIKTANQITTLALRNSVNVAKIPVQRAQSALRELNNISKSKLTTALSTMNKTVDEENRLEIWAEEQKSRFMFVSNNTKSKGIQKIQKFLQVREMETQKCVKDVMVPIQQLFNETRRLSASALRTIDNTITSIQNCLKIWPTPAKIRQCGVDIRQSLRKILNVPEKAIALKAKFAGNRIDQIINAPCVFETKTKTEREKELLQKILDELLASDIAERTTTIETSESSTTARFSTTVNGSSNLTTDSFSTTLNETSNLTTTAYEVASSTVSDSLLNTSTTDVLDSSSITVNGPSNPITIVVPNSSSITSNETLNSTAVTSVDTSSTVSDSSSDYSTTVVPDLSSTTSNEISNLTVIVTEAASSTVSDSSLKTSTTDVLDSSSTTVISDSFSTTSNETSNSTAILSGGTFSTVSDSSSESSNSQTTTSTPTTIVLDSLTTVQSCLSGY